MRIVCPACSVGYDVPDSLMTAGRVVRCARCTREWMPVAATEPEAAAAPASDEPEAPPTEAPAARLAPTARQSAMDRLAANPALPSGSLRLRLAWAASVLLLVLAVAAAYIWRSEIMAGWPPSARAYAAFGLYPAAEQSRRGE